MGTAELLELTAPAMQKSVAEVVLPWFASMSNADAVLAECAFSLSWWRTVSSERRTLIAASLAELMDLEKCAVPEFNLRKG